MSSKYDPKNDSPEVIRVKKGLIKQLAEKRVQQVYEGDIKNRIELCKNFMAEAQKIISTNANKDEDIKLSNEQLKNLGNFVNQFKGARVYLEPYIEALQKNNWREVADKAGQGIPFENLKVEFIEKDPKRLEDRYYNFSNMEDDVTEIIEKEFYKAISEEARVALVTAWQGIESSYSQVNAVYEKNAEKDILLTQNIQAIKNQIDYFQFNTMHQMRMDSVLKEWYKDYNINTELKEAIDVSQKLSNNFRELFKQIERHNNPQDLMAQTMANMSEYLSKVKKIQDKLPKEDRFNEKFAILKGALSIGANKAVPESLELKFVSEMQNISNFLTEEKKRADLIAEREIQIAKDKEIASEIQKAIQEFDRALQEQIKIYEKRNEGRKMLIGDINKVAPLIAASKELKKVSDSFKNIGSKDFSIDKAKNQIDKTINKLNNNTKALPPGGNTLTKNWKEFWNKVWTKLFKKPYFTSGAETVSKKGKTIFSEYMKKPEKAKKEEAQEEVQRDNLPKKDKP